MRIPITQQHIADTLGLSLVHTNKTIRKLMDRKLIVWREAAARWSITKGSSRSRDGKGCAKAAGR